MAGARTLAPKGCGRCAGAEFEAAGTSRYSEVVDELADDAMDDAMDEALPRRPRSSALPSLPWALVPRGLVPAWPCEAGAHFGNPMAASVSSPTSPCPREHTPLLLPLPAPPP